MPHDLKVRLDVIKEGEFCHSIHGGKGQRRCRKCNNHRGFNRKYDINLCRRCLHETLPIMGFKKFD